MTFRKPQCCKWTARLWPCTLLHSPYGLCTKKSLLSLLLLIVLVCKLLSIPVYPEWRDNQASHVAKGRSECTGDGPHLPWSFPVQWNRKCSKPCSYETRNCSNLKTVLPNRCNSVRHNTYVIGRLGHNSWNKLMLHKYFHPVNIINSKWHSTMKMQMSFHWTGTVRGKQYTATNTSSYHSSWDLPPQVTAISSYIICLSRKGLCRFSYAHRFILHITA